jgi:hypothetical protein
VKSEKGGEQGTDVYLPVSKFVGDEVLAGCLSDRLLRTTEIALIPDH